MGHQVVVGQPFESSIPHSVPCGLYFYLLCHKINLTIDRAIVALILIERIVSKSSDERPETRFGKNLTSDFLLFDSHGLQITPLTVHR